VLAAWMRLKYPHIAVGALASSAPILQFEDIVPLETFYDIVSNDFKVSEIVFLPCFGICPCYKYNKCTNDFTLFVCINSVKVPLALTI
jgi:hypothetical protein